MKKVLFLVFLISTSVIVSGEEPVSSGLPQTNYPGKVSKDNKPKSLKNNFPRWAVHSNLLGFVQFGPVVSAEFGVTRNFVLNAHARFPSVGALTKILHGADIDRGGRPDKYSGIAFGGGPLYFFNVKKDKAYAGILFEYELSDVLYMEDYVNEWTQDNKKLIFMLNSGYRFRFGQKLIPGSHRQVDKFIREGLFLNTGVYVGAERNKYNWNYTDPDAGLGDLTPREGKKIRPFGMVEVSVGLEF
jgi:hypothetical protein